MNPDKERKTHVVFSLIYVLLQVQLIILSFTESLKTISNETGFSAAENITKDIIVPFEFILIFCLFYYMFRLRNILMKPSARKVTNKLTTRMIAIGDMTHSGTLSEEQRKAIVLLYYHYVAHDNTLKIKHKNVILNEEILISVIDILILSIPCIIMYLVLSIQHSKIILALIVTTIIFILCIPAYLCLVDRYISLSDDELDYIHDHNNEALKAGIAQILK